MPRFHFEDFGPGVVDLPGSATVTADEIVAFAREFDAQPFHTDEEAAKQTFAGGLIASGWHSCGILMRLVADGFINQSSSMGAPGVEELKWLRPVRPGDTLRVRRTFLEAKPSRSRPEMGLVRFEYELLNQRDEVVLSQRNWAMLGRRGAALSPGQSADPPAGSVPAAPVPPPSVIAPAPFFEDLAIGETAELGSYAFTAEAIIRFAKKFDPQPFHVDPEAAKESFFGGLIASGWHTAAAWMKRLVERRTAQREAAVAKGQRPANFGPSPGFRELRWVKPVYAGNTLAFRTTIIDKRPSASRPEWGLVMSHNTGHNQRGELVYEFKGSGFVERRER